MQRIFTLSTLSVGLALGAVSVLSAQTSDFTTIDFPGAAGTQAYGINPRGDVAGFYTLADKTSHGFVLTGSNRYTTIDYPGATSTQAGAINAKGDVAGQYTAADGITHGFVLRGSAFTTIDYPGAKLTSPGAINARGDVVGGYTLPDNTRHGFLWRGEKFTTVDFPGASTTVPSGNNARGDVVGGYMIAGVAHGFLWSGGKFSSYDFPGSTSTQAYGISARGEIAGRYVVGGVTHGFVLSGGQFTTIDFPGASYTGAYSINTNDDILGQYQIGGVFHTFVMTRRVRHEAHYAITDLGTLGGSFSIAFGINDAGEVAGAANIPSETAHPFFWSGGTFADLGTLGGPNGSAGGPNGSNQLAGPVETSTADPLGEDFCGYGSHLVCLGVSWHDGVMTRLSTLGGNNAQAYTLNNHGQAVGVAETRVRDSSCTAPQALQFQAVTWGPKAGEVQVLPPLPGDTVGFALAINDRGQAVGSTGTCQNTFIGQFALGPHAVIWTHGTPVPLGTLGGYSASAGAAINNRGEVAGGSFLADEKTFHSYLWTQATGMIDSGTVDADVSAYPMGINDGGQVVGTSCDTDISGNCRAYLWQYLGQGSAKEVVMRDLNTLVSADSPYYLVSASGINNAGEIVGLAVDERTGDAHAFLASPVDGGTRSPSVMSSLRSPWRIPEKARTLLRQRAPAGGIR